MCTFQENTGAMASKRTGIPKKGHGSCNSLEQNGWVQSMGENTRIILTETIGIPWEFKGKPLNYSIFYLPLSVQSMGEKKGNIPMVFLRIP